MLPPQNHYLQKVSRKFLHFSRLPFFSTRLFSLLLNYFLSLFDDIYKFIYKGWVNTSCKTFLLFFLFFFCKIPINQNRNWMRSGDKKDEKEKVDWHLHRKNRNEGLNKSYCRFNFYWPLLLPPPSLPFRVQTV